MSSQWTFFTNYGHVIFLISKNSNITVREMASSIGITERAVQRLVSNLEEDGFLKISKRGRQNSYKVVGEKHLKHDIEKNCHLDELIQVIAK